MTQVINYFIFFLQKLEQLLHPILNECYKTHNIEITQMHTILMGIWILTSTESIESVAERFSVSKLCCQQSFKLFCNTITKNYRVFVHWPNPRMAQQIIHKFNDFTTDNTITFPNVCGVIGCLDFKRISTFPKENGNEGGVDNHNLSTAADDLDYMKLQCVCDSRGIFLDSFVKVAPKTSVFTIFNSSPLHARLEKGAIHVRPNSHLIGDRSYPLRKFLLVPFKERKEKLTGAQRRYNDSIHSRIRILDLAFYWLKERFAKLTCLHMHLASEREQCVLVACAIHNICIQNMDSYYIGNETDMQVVADNNQPGETCHDVNVDVEIIGKQNVILRTFEN